jgi:hypothetical protein
MIENKNFKMSCVGGYDLRKTHGGTHGPGATPLSSELIETTDKVIGGQFNLSTAIQKVAVIW